MGSFGITPLEVAFGKPPFANKKLGEVMRNVQAGQTHAWMKEAFKSKQHVLSPKFKDLVEKCLKTNPKDRPTAENLLKHTFFEKHARDAKWLRKYFINPLASKSKRTQHKRRRLTNQRVINRLLRAGETLS